MLILIVSVCMGKEYFCRREIQCCILFVWSEILKLYLQCSISEVNDILMWLSWKEISKLLIVFAVQYICYLKMHFISFITFKFNLPC